MTTEPRRLLHTYRNGNYRVWLYCDGTKIKRTDGTEFVADFPDSIDIKITDRCDMNCPMCHENSSAQGKHGDLNADFLNTVHYGTELAVGGGNPLAHPELETFLERMNDRGVVCNLTVNEEHFLRERSRVENMLGGGIIHGLGISLSRAEDMTVDFAKKHGTVVFHVVCGMQDENTLAKLYDKGLKTLLLGYKKIGRGAAFFGEKVQSKIDSLKKNIKDIARRFDIVSFDNLAIEQLDLRGAVPSDLFEKRYMGDDGTASMFIDLVQHRFAVSSTSTARYPTTSDIIDMFQRVKTLSGR